MVFGPAEAFTPDQLIEQYDVNVLGAQRVNRAALASEVGTRRKLQYVTEIKTLVDSFSITDVRCARSSATKRSRQKIARRALLPRRVTVPDEEREEPMSVQSRKYSLAARALGL